MATDVGVLLAEGYLRKIRGWGQNRSRWFRLSNTSFSYYTKDAGDLIATCPISEIESVKHVSKYQIEIVTKIPFGKSNATEMILEAPTEGVKDRWERALGMAQLEAGVAATDHTPVEDVLVAEGYLVKVQDSMLALSRTRWFVLTRGSFSYWTEEAGELLATCQLSNMKAVGIVDDLTFNVIAHMPFTKTGANNVFLACRDGAERDRWLRSFDMLLPGKVCVSEYSPLPAVARSEKDHFGVLITSDKSAKYLSQHAEEGESQGNRFIRDPDL